MMKYILLIIVFVSITLSFTIAQEKNIGSTKNDVITDELYEHQKFKRWINFWKLKIPEIENFIIENTDTIKWILPHKVNLNNWFQERKIREQTLDYSQKKDFVTDVYSNIVFEYENDTIYAKGGDIDESFQIINLIDSVQYWFTLGPYSFIDESIWLSDSICYILGFNLDAIAEAYCKIIILKWDFEKEFFIICYSQKLPFYNGFMRVSTYMNYLYPEFR